MATIRTGGCGTGCQPPGFLSSIQQWLTELVLLLFFHPYPRTKQHMDYGEPVSVVSPTILLDGLFQSFLLGIVLTQAIKYWADYRDDSWRKRTFVASVVLFTLFQTILEDYKTWRIVIHRKRWSTSAVPWADLFLNGIIASLCEGFFIRRCWKATKKSPWTLGPLTLLAATTIIANIYLATATGIALRTFVATNDTLNISRYLLPSTKVAFTYWIFGTLTLDVVVTCILVTFLWRSKVGSIETDRIVLHVIHLTWETTALPSICLLTAAILYHGVPSAHDHLVLFFTLLTGKLYAIGLLRTLNSRMKLRQRMQSRKFGRTSLWDRPENGPAQGDVRPQILFCDINSANSNSG
ncbi:hypothetical protein BD779DRAFT_405271 [Infundibulicybe gibba]|nr:hypothetical protein BD779DRAFT_405271 [Infundibulicybe gibba]